MKAIVLILINFLITFGFSVSDGLFAVVFKDVVGNGIFLSFAFFFYSFSKIIFSPFAGRILDSMGVERVLGFSLVLFTAVSAVFILSDDKIIILTARIIQGCACAFFRPVLLCGIASEGKFSNLGRRAGQLDISFYLALAAGTFYGGFLFDASGKTGVFISIALCCVMSLLLFLLFRECLKTHGTAKEKPSANRLIPAANPALTGYLVYIFFKAWGISSVCIYLPVLMHNQGFTASNIGFAVSIPPFVMAFFLLFTGRLADILKKNTMVFTGGAVAAASYLSIPFAYDLPSIILIIIIGGAAGAFSQPALAALLLESAPDGQTGRTIGLFNTVMGLGFSVSPIINGLLLKFAGIGSIFIIAGITGLLSSMYFADCTENLVGDAADYKY